MSDECGKTFLTILLCFSTGGNVSKLLELSKELEELLLIQDEFRLPLCAVLSEYQSWFAKKTPFDPVVYGFTSVVSLLEALPSVVKVCTSRKVHLLSRNMLIPSYSVQASVLPLRFPPQLSLNVFDIFR